jgi:hypothetical protein
MLMLGSFGQAVSGSFSKTEDGRGKAQGQPDRQRATIRPQSQNGNREPGDQPAVAAIAAAEPAPILPRMTESPSEMCGVCLRWLLPCLPLGSRGQE